MAGWVVVGKLTLEKVVYHYTDSAGLIGILDSKTLHASSSSALNDVSELAYGVNRIKEIGSELHAADVELAQLLHAQIKELEASMLSREYFMTSASKNPDSLNLWRNYAGGGGYSIGLGQPTMYGLVVDQYPDTDLPSGRSTPTWADVTYTSVDQEALVSTALRDELNSSESSLRRAFAGDRGLLDSFQRRLTLIAAQLKHPAFFAEEEVRLLIEPGNTVQPNFRPGRNGIVNRPGFHAVFFL